MSKIEGSCLCGQIHYQSSAEPAVMALCHCTHCQKQSGSAFSALVAVPAGTLEINRAQLKFYDDKGDSGQPVRRGFCPNCGSAVISEVAVTPDLEWIKAGTLNDTSWYSPTVSIWCDSAQKWTPMPEGMVKVPGSPPRG